MNDNNEMSADDMRKQWAGKSWTDLTQEQQAQARAKGLSQEDFPGSNS